MIILKEHKMVGYEDQSIVQELLRIYLRQLVSTRSHSLPGARVDGNLRCLSGYAGVHIHTSRRSRKWGRSSADSVLKALQPSHGAGATQIQTWPSWPALWLLNWKRMCQPWTLLMPWIRHSERIQRKGCQAVECKLKLCLSFWTSTAKVAIISF